MAELLNWLVLKKRKRKFLAEAPCDLLVARA
jgi:hypothetical protein